MTLSELRIFLDTKTDEYNQPQLIPFDPISVPHEFKKKQDIEIAGFIASVFAWGQRKTTINKSKEFLNLMGNEPHRFVLEHKDTDLLPFQDFKHRTFNGTDALYFLHFFRWFYTKHESLEAAFIPDAEPFNRNCDEPGQTGQTEAGLIHFFKLFFSLPEYPKRTCKHIPTPIRKSACKRLNLFLRWMVRSDDKGVDFGLWRSLKSSRLICPLDVHAGRVARSIGLITGKTNNWQTALELTKALEKLDPRDPVKYDFALFGLGEEGKF